MCPECGPSVSKKRVQTRKDVSRALLGPARTWIPARWPVQEA
jgi:hypothetical protein